MPLPGILLPAGTPPFLINGHGAQWQAPHVNIGMTTGHMRKRRTVTSMPNIVSASLLLERDQMAAFRAWFHNTLKSGERRFTAHVKEQGAGMLYYEAFFVGMYRAPAMHLGRWRVDMTLQLFGDGETVAPFTGLLATTITLDLDGSGALRVPILLRTRIELDLVQSLSLRTRIELDLEE